MRHSRFSAASATLFALVLFCTGASLAIENKLNVPIMPLKDVKIGMRGEAYTVFTGTVPEKMEVEVLGVMRNMAGPKGDVILVRLHGEKAEYTGVVAGMSGSPVYIDGKLVGALAYRIGEFSKEPIGALTPIQSMLEINDMDTTPGSSPIASPAKTSSPVPAAGAGAPASLPGSQPLVSYLKPIETPLVFNGFSEEAIRLFAPQFAAAGVMPVMGAGSSSDVKQPEPLQAGSAVGAVLVRGDMDIAATCTVTYVDEDHLLACGHPFLNYGQVSMPMTKSQVLATLPSPANAFKIANTTETVGSFVQDRKTGILGRFGKDAQMIPVTLNLHATGRDRTLRFEVLNNARLTPAVMMAAVFNGIQGNNDYGEDVTFRVKGAIEISGHPRLEIGNMYAPAEGGTPTGQQIAAWVGERFSRIFDNPYERPDILGVTLNVDLIRERRWAKLETARTDVTEARPGEEIMVETVVRPYRGERIVRQIPIRIPTSAPRGTLRILVSDGDTLDRMRRMGTPMARKYDLASTIAMLNKEHANSSIYVSLLQSNPQAVVEDKVMPALPLSVMNVMDGMRGTQDMVVTAESSIEEASTSLDYVVSGAKVLTVAVR